MIQFANRLNLIVRRDVIPEQVLVLLKERVFHAVGTVKRQHINEDLILLGWEYRELDRVL